MPARVPAFVTELAGVSFDGRQAHIRRQEPGDAVRLSREPDNAYDPSAVAVRDSRGRHLGYLPARLTNKVHGDGPWRGEVVGLRRGETYGIEIRVFPLTDPDAPSSPAAGGVVRTKSGRNVGAFVEEHDGTVTVRAADGTEMAYPASQVVIPRGAEVAPDPGE